MSRQPWVAVVLVGEELLGGALDGHATLALVLLGVHVEGEGEGALAEGLGHFLELLHLTLGDASELEEQATSGGRLSRVDVATDDHGHVLLCFRHCLLGYTNMIEGAFDALVRSPC